jgi:hypothetical protein
MKRKQRKRAASTRAKTTKKGTKARRSALKRKPARAVKAKRTKSAGRAKAKATKAKQPAAKRTTSAAARTNGATSRRAPKPEQAPVLEHAVIIQEEETGLNVGGYDENEDFEETYTEEEEELPEESEEDYWRLQRGAATRHEVRPRVLTSLFSSVTLERRLLERILRACQLHLRTHL